MFKRKEYVRTVKFCTVLADYFYPRRRSIAERAFYVDAGGASDDAESLFPSSGDADLEATVDPDYRDVKLVERVIDWIFDPTRRIPPGRFNDASFPALYGAKEPITARKERAWWGTAGVEYVMFSVAFSGSVVDLRPAIDAGVFQLEPDHNKCRAFAADVFGTCDGIASYSYRHRDGSCCAIFVRAGVEPGVITEESYL